MTVIGCPSAQDERSKPRAMLDLHTFGEGWDMHRFITSARVRAGSCVFWVASSFSKTETLTGSPSLSIMSSAAGRAGENNVCGALGLLLSQVQRQSQWV